MNDTPRVTVPVEPALDLSNEQIQSVMLEAVREVRATVTDHDEAAAMDADIVRMGRGPVDMGSTGWEVMRAVHRRLAMLSAAPAPEGGAVLDALDEALIYIERLGENIERNDLDMHLDTVERPFSFAQTMRGRFPSLCAALAAREEDPANTGECPCNLKGDDCHPDCPHGREEAPAEAGEPAETGNGPLYDLVDFLRPEFREETKLHLARRTSDLLLAQPPASEDAQPVWVDGVPTKHHAKEWFIAETAFGDRVVLTALPEEYAYDFKTADETYIKADRIKRWMPFPDSQYLFPHPAPDALRAAMEALKMARTGYCVLRTIMKAKDLSEGYATALEHIDAIDQALAALQSEQGAK